VISEAIFDLLIDLLFLFQWPVRHGIIDWHCFYFSGQ